MPIDQCMLFGAGGHAKVVLEALLALYPHCTVMVRDDDPSMAGNCLLGHSICTPCITAHIDTELVHVAIGDNAVRQRLAMAALEGHARLLNIVHPAATLSPSATLGTGIFVAAQAVIGPEAKVAHGVIVNHGAIVDHDCHIGAWTHVAPGVVLGGGVRVGTGVLLGSGCVVLPGRILGDGAVVGAGAVVTRDVPTGQKIMGVPAK